MSILMWFYFYNVNLYKNVCENNWILIPLGQNDCWRWGTDFRIIVADINI